MSKSPVVADDLRLSAPTEALELPETHINAFDVAIAAPWAIVPSWLSTILDIAAGNGDVEAAMRLRRDAVESIRAQPLAGAGRVGVRDGVAIVSIRGPIFRYANLFTSISGATSIQTSALDFRSAMDSPQIDAVILDVDSPGGMVTGVNEFAEQIFNARGNKPIVAYAGGMAASAAYWLSSAADEVVADATAELGSIGVVMGYIDNSEQNRKRGVEQIEIVSSISPNKRPDPKTDAGMAELKRRVDDLADVFVSAVAQYRGITPDAVAEQYGRGSMLAGQSAVDAGLADRLGSLDSLISELSLSASKPKPRRMFMTENTKQTAASEDPVVTVATIKADHPDVAAALIDEGKASIDVSAIEAAASDQGAKAERDRIVALLAIETIDSKDKIRAAVEDGKATAESLAVEILKAGKDRGSSLSAIADESQGTNGAAPADSSKKNHADAWDKSFKKAAANAWG